MEIARDPVGRLYNLLQSLFEERNRTIGTQLAKLFSVPTSDTSVILRLYAELAFLVVEGQNSVRRLEGFTEDDLADFLNPLNQVATALSQSSPNHQVHQLQSQIPSEIMMGLKLCSRVLSRDHPESTVTDEQLNDLFESLCRVSSQILEAPINPELKNILLQHLETMIRAVREYRIRGSRGLREAIEGGMGAAIIEMQKYPTGKEKDVIKDYAIVIGFGVTLLDLGLKSRELLEPILPMLLGTK